MSVKIQTRARLLLALAVLSICGTCTLAHAQTLEQVSARYASLLEVKTGSQQGIDDANDLADDVLIYYTSVADVFYVDEDLTEGDFYEGDWYLSDANSWLATATVSLNRHNLPDDCMSAWDYMTNAAYYLNQAQVLIANNAPVAANAMLDAAESCYDQVEAVVSECNSELLYASDEIEYVETDILGL